MSMDERNEEEVALLRKRLQQAARWSEGGPVPADPGAPPPEAAPSETVVKPKRRRAKKAKPSKPTETEDSPKQDTVQEAKSAPEPEQTEAAPEPEQAEPASEPKKEKAGPGPKKAAKPAKRRGKTAKGETAMDVEEKPVKTEVPAEQLEDAPDTAEQPEGTPETAAESTPDVSDAETAEEKSADTASGNPANGGAADAEDKPNAADTADSPKAADTKDNPNAAENKPQEVDPDQKQPEGAVPAWAPTSEEAFEEILEEERKETERKDEEDRQAPRKDHGFLSRLAERKLPPWLARLVDRLQKMELPEKVNLPKWLGPINKLNLPNQLTLLRIVLIPIMMGILYWGFPGSRYVALLVFIAASITDMLDGRIARKYNLVTDFGKFADPLADKMLVTAAMLWFVQTGKMPAWALLIVVCREFAVSGLRMLASGKGRVIAAGWSGKVKTASTMVCLVLMFFPIPALLNTICVWIITLTTLYSGIEYFLLNRDVISSI